MTSAWVTTELPALGPLELEEGHPLAKLELHNERAMVARRGRKCYAVWRGEFVARDDAGGAK